MPQSLAQIYLHIVFSTKDRNPFLRDAELRKTLYAYMAGVLKNLGSPALKIGGVEDHVHMLCRLTRTGTLSDLVRDLKRDTSKWIKENGRGLEGFGWQLGYGAFSISPSHVEQLIQYIENQEEHHRAETFQDELLRLLTKYEVMFDERYLWE